MPEHDKYQLRPRGAPRRRPRDPRESKPRRPRTPQPLSKYRRKTANARERSRMREINIAFETLRKVVPAAPAPCEKLTKITTLRLAMKYITALASALRDGSEPLPQSPQDLSDFSPEPSTLSEDSIEDSLSPFDTFFAEFDCDYLDRTFV